MDCVLTAQGRETVAGPLATTAAGVGVGEKEAGMGVGVGWGQVSWDGNEVACSPWLPKAALM